MIQVRPCRRGTTVRCCAFHLQGLTARATTASVGRVGRRLPQRACLTCMQGSAASCSFWLQKQRSARACLPTLPHARPCSNKSFAVCVEHSSPPMTHVNRDGLDVASTVPGLMPSSMRRLRCCRLARPGSGCLLLDASWPVAMASRQARAAMAPTSNRVACAGLSPTALRWPGAGDGRLSRRRGRAVCMCCTLTECLMAVTFTVRLGTR